MKKKSSKKTARQGLIRTGVGKIAKTVGGLFTSEPSDIVEAIKQDHEGLRNFIKTLKDADKPMAERKRAYAAFSSLLKSHSACEEKAVYQTSLELVGREMHLKITEGYVEHGLGDDLMARINRTKDPMQWSAHANVLAEVVAHHLDEEESDLLPLIRKAATPEQNAEMLAEFVGLRRKTQKKRTPENAGVLKSVAK